MFHLPDLPNAGYATTREKALSDNIMNFMREVERDRVRLLTLVTRGREMWKRVAADIWRPYRIGEDATLLDDIYNYFVLQAAPPRVQRELLDNLQNPAVTRDIHKRLMPHVEQELETLQLVEKWKP